MNAYLETFGLAAGLWQESFWRATWQGAIVLTAAWAIARWCTFLSPRVICWIWRLACLKLFIAVVGFSPVNLPWLPAGPAPAAVAPVSAPPVSQWIELNDPQNPGAFITFNDPPAVNSRPPFSVVPCLLFVVWSIGVVYFLGRTLRQWRAVRRLQATSQPCTAEPLPRLLAEEAERLGVKRLPTLRFSGQLESPLLIGLMRPAIVLPAAVAGKFDEAELRLMIAHELAHQKRRDLAWNWLPTVACWLFYFHPLVWLMMRRWSQAQEAACDELLIQRRAAEPAPYGRLLVKLATGSVWESGNSLATAGVLGAYRNLEQRILLMTRVRPFSPRRLAAAAGLLAIAAGMVIVPWRLVAQQPKPQLGAIESAGEPQQQQVAQLDVAAEPANAAPADGEAEPEPEPVITANFIANRTHPPKTGLDPVSDRALARLKELGARITADEKGDPTVYIDQSWHGPAADLALIADLADLKTLFIDLDYVAAEAVGKIKLKRPLDVYIVSGLSDKRLTALARLPKCSRLILPQESLSTGGFQQLAALADGVEFLEYFGETEINDEQLAAICRIATLQGLTLQSSRITDAGLAPLGRLEKLKELAIFNCRGVRGPGYADLASAKALRKLSILGPPFSGAGYRALATLAQLEELWLQFDASPPGGFQLADLEALKKLTHLNTLLVGIQGRTNEVPEAPSGDAILAVAGQLPELRVLSVFGITTAAAGLEALAKTPQLEKLTLGQAEISDQALAALGAIKTLKALNLISQGTVSPTAWTKLIGLKQLTTLSIPGSSIDDAGLAQLAKLPALGSLVLTASKITGTGLASLANLAALKSLTLSDSPLGDQGGAGLRQLKALEWLDLGGTNITDRSLDAIAALPNLRVLNLDRTAVTATGLMKLADLKRLAQISVIDVKLSADDLTRLRAALPEVQIQTVAIGADWLTSQPSRGSDPDNAQDAEAAEQDMRRRYEKDPQQILAFAALLGRHGKLDEAFALYEKARETQSLPNLCGSAVETLRTNFDRASDAQKQQVEGLLTAAIQATPDVLGLQAMLIDLLEREDRFADAIAAYRGLLARGDLDKRSRAVFQNNLAFQLVTQGADNDLAEAQTLIDAAVAQLGSIGAVVDTRGLIRLAQGDAKGAVADFKLAIRQAPTATNYFYLALAEDKSKNAKGAAEAFHKAEELQLDPDQLAGRPRREYDRLKKALTTPEKR